MTSMMMNSSNAAKDEEPATITTTVAFGDDEEEEPVLLLESGFSLSEQAHEILTAPMMMASSSSNNNNNNNDKTNTNTNTNTNNHTMATTSQAQSVQELRESVVQDMVGIADTIVTSPFEWNTKKSKSKSAVPLPLVYCDFTASHRPLTSLETYLTRTCIPYYGNTHTNTSLTGSQSTAFVSEARQLIGEACGAKTTGKASQDVVLFAGNGATSAVQLLIDCLGLKHATATATTAKENENAENSRPLILVGPYEHHSNLLPWRELGNADIVIIQLCSSNDSNGNGNGNVDLKHLERVLQKNQHRSVKIGSFSAASNLTGTIAQDLEITALLHQYGALSIWDYATGASYLDMNMNPTTTTNTTSSSSSNIAKDAIFFSGHKLLGGVGTPGVLVVKKRLVSQLNPPNRSGGGTVFYVTQDHHRFLSNRMERYEGGTPNVIGIWRLGLVIACKQQLKRAFESTSTSGTTSTSLVEHDIQRATTIQQRLEQISNLVLIDGRYYGDEAAKKNRPSKLPIFSFLIKCGPRFLHYNYVCALLNDLFGIQSRGGCQCAGPYAQQLLGMNANNSNLNQAVEDWLVHSKNELLRPGVTRLSLPTLGTTQAQEDYVVEAIAFVAQHGWKFLHVYRCNHRAGEWRHKSRPGAPLGKQERKWLSHYRTFLQPEPTPGLSSTSSQEHQQQQQQPPSLSQATQNAKELLQLVLQDQSSISQALKMTQEDDSTSLRWYVYPKEVATFIREGLDRVPGTNDRDNLLGALRPLAWYPAAINEENEDEDEPSTTIIAAAAAAATATATSEKSSSLTPPSITTTPSNLSFRDGEHLGMASMEEIQQGYEDGELSDACLIYDPPTESWEAIDVFLKRQGTTLSLASAAAVEGMETTNSTTTNGPSDKATTDVLLAFRDGEHSGEASWEEIQAGYEDGELSNQCEIFNTEKEAWQKFDSSASQKQSPMVADAIDDDALALEAPSLAKLHAAEDDLPILEKNEKKKPQRDSSAWGQGSMVTLLPPPDTETVDQQQPKRKKSKHVKPPPKMMRLITQAMIQWDMLEEGDRLLLGLSGGKDSLSLLHALLEFKKKLPINFEIEVCTIDPMTASFDPSPMIQYVASLGLKYHYIKDDIVERAANAGKDGNMVSSLCAFCARMKRGNLYSCARENNCNKLVLAQHLDDLAESFMMSVMHNGFLRTMKANYKINAGDLSVIRPLVYCRESIMTDFAKSANLPIINENCPACFEEPKERARIKKLLSREETLYPNFYDNIKRAMLPLMHDESTAILRSYTEEALAKSRKENPTQMRLIGSKPRQQEKKCRPNENNTNEGEIEEKKEGPEDAGHAALDSNATSLADASEEELVRELARRRAAKFRLAGAMKRLPRDDDDPTGQVCTLNGGNGSIPCRELME